MINRVSLEKAVYVLKIAVVGPPRSGKSIIVATLLFFLRDHLNVDIKHVQTDVKDIVVPQIIRGEKPIKRKEFDLKEYIVTTFFDNITYIGSPVIGSFSDVLYTLTKTSLTSVFTIF